MGGLKVSGLIATPVDAGDDVIERGGVRV